MNTKDFKILFNKSKITFIKSRISQFFTDWGLCFESKPIDKRIDGKFTRLTYRKLSNIDIIDEYIMRT
jgi:hypothetical protein